LIYEFSYPIKRINPVDSFMYSYHSLLISDLYIHFAFPIFLAGFHELISNVLTCSVGMLKVKHTLRDTYVSITPLSCRIFKYCYVITYCNEKCCRIFIFDACLSLSYLTTCHWWGEYMRWVSAWLGVMLTCVELHIS